MYSRVSLTISVAACVWAAFALARAGSVHQDAVRGDSGRAVQLAGGVDDHRLRDCRRAALQRAAREIGRQTRHIRVGVCARRSRASSVSDAGAADTVPVPVCRRNVRVAVVFPAKRAHAGVPFAATR